MEQNMPVIAKRVWSLVRVMFYMLRKGLSSKGKLMTEFNMMMKRGKIAGKALQNLMFHHHQHHHHAWSLSTFNRRTHNRNLPPFFPSPPPPGEYEFSCGNSPAYPVSLISSHKNHNNHHSNDDFFSCANSPQADDQDMVSINIAAVTKALQMEEAPSPAALPGLIGKRPPVRQLRITDSPFPLRGAVGVEDGQVDEAAEKFIMKFYNELRRQNKEL